MFLGFGQLKQLLSDLHPEAGEPLIEARLKYFQREGFPAPRINVGTGWRASYDAASTWRVILAFQFLDFGLPPLMATTLIGDHWDMIGPAIAFAWSQPERIHHHHHLMHVRPNMLGGREFKGSVKFVRMGDVPKALNDKSPRGGGVIMLDLTRLSRSLGVRMARLGFTEERGWFDAQTRELSQAL